MANDPTAVYQTQVGFAPEVAPYGQQLLGRAQALTDVNQNPYQSYSDWAQQQGLSGDQVAQFSGLQNQAFQQTANLGYNPYSQMAATGLGNVAGAEANTSFTPTTQSFTDPGAAQSYMNPYLMNALAPQIELLREQQGIQGAQQHAQATQAGAFGGSRMGVQDAQQNQANQLAMSNLIGQGYNTAFGQAQNQYNADLARQQQSAQFGAGLGLQGLQAASGTLGAMGSAGQNLYGQNVSNINLQNQLGTQQQQQAQNMLNVSQQNYLAQQNDPYNKLNFQSNIIRGLPTTTLGSQVYQAPPSMLGQVAGIGAAAKAFGLKKGGNVKGGLPHLLASTIG